MKAFEKYEEFDATLVSGSSSELANPLNLDTLETADETDFGFLGRLQKSPWDTSYAVFNGMKALGVDSIFVGHEHCNSVSIVYEGVRFQYSQKSSTYDRYNWVLEDGTIAGGYTMPNGAHPLLGGTVIPVSSVDGSIGTGYICYAGNPFYFEPKPVEMPVDGLQLTSADLQDGYGMSLHGTAFDENVNAYKIYSEKQGKVFDTALAAQYDVFTFNVFVPEDAPGSGWNIALRVKPDGTLTNEQGCTDTKYVFYQMNVGSDAINYLPRGQWRTISVDISNIDETCTEFSIMFAAGTTAWFRDIAFTEAAEKIVVNGLQYGGVANESDLWTWTDADGSTDRGSITAETYTNADGSTVNAYKVTSSENYQNKLYVNTALLKGKSTVTFSILVDSKAYTSDGSSTAEYMLRIKPTQTAETLPGISGNYVSYDTNADGDLKVVLGEWKTITIDITPFADVCTEFSILISGGNNAIWVKDFAIS